PVLPLGIIDPKPRPLLAPLFPFRSLQNPDPLHRDAKQNPGSS
ncbi:unnamed protein product, partial [Musa acuminata var. zebrina]